MGRVAPWQGIGVRPDAVEAREIARPRPAAHVGPAAGERRGESLGILLEAKPRRPVGSVPYFERTSRTGPRDRRPELRRAVGRGPDAVACCESGPR